MLKLELYTQGEELPVACVLAERTTLCAPAVRAFVGGEAGQPDGVLVQIVVAPEMLRRLAGELIAAQARGELG